MEQATFIDIFSEAGRAVRGVRNLVDENERKKADAFIKTVPDWFETEINNYTRDNPYNFTGNPDSPDELENYTREYQKKQQYFIRESFAKKFGSNAGIGYYKQAMDQMQTHALEKARGFALLKQDETRIGNAQERFAKSVTAYRDTLPPDRAWEAFNNSINLLKADIEITPQSEQNMRAQFGKQIYEKAANELLGQVNDVNDLKAAMDALKDRFSFMPPDVISAFDEEGNVTGTEERPWSYEGKSEWEQKQLAAQTERIQGEHFGTLREQKSYVDRCLASGDLDEAIRASRIGGAWLNKAYNPNNIQYANLSEDQRYAARDWFDVGKLEGYAKQKLGKEMALFDAYPMEMFLRPQLKGGDGTVIVGYNEKNEPITRQYKSLKEAMEGFIYFKREAFMHDKGGEDSVNLQLWEAEQAKFFENYYSELGTALNQIDSTLALEFGDFRKFDTYIKNEKSEFYNSDVKKMSPEERDAYAQRCVNFFESIFFNGVTDAPAIRKAMRDFTAEEKFRYMTKVQVGNNEEEHLKQLKAFSDKAKSGEAEDILFVRYNPERLNIAGQTNTPTFEFRSPEHEKAVNQVAENERRIVANILGFPVDGLLSDWMASGRRKGDVIPKAQFTVKSKFSSDSGTYYLDYEANGRPVVMRQTGFDKDGNPVGEVYKKFEGPITKDEYIQAIRDGKDPRTGEDFDYSGPPPGTSKEVWGNTKYQFQKISSWADYLMQQDQGRWK